MHTIDIIFLLYGLFFFFFFFNDTATTEIYTLSLHDALPIWGHAWLEVVADTAAETKHAVADIINVMLEELVHHRYELPAFSTLDRMAYRAREKSNNRYFSAITNQLTAHTRTLIDSLLKTATGESVSAWQMLKREPKRPTNKETRTYIQHIRRLQYLEIGRAHV